MEAMTEYAGLFIKFTERAGAAPGQPGYVVVNKDNANVMPGATFAKTLQQAMRMIDVYRVVDGDGQKFWHLLRAIQRGADAESQAVELLTRIAEASDACPMNNIRMWARQARDLMKHGKVLTVYDRERLGE